MEALAKQLTRCDNCKAELKKEEDTENNNIQATLANGKKEHQQYHYCNEECLRQHLNGRAKRKRAMAAVVSSVSPNSVELSMSKEDDRVSVTHLARGLMEVEWS